MAETTKAGILIDTSVWIALFRDTEPYASVLAGILKEGRGHTGIIKAETIQGTRSASEGERALGVFGAVESLEITDALWVKAGRLAADLRRKGSMVPLTDAALGALAAEHGLSVYTLDKHFDVMPEVKIYQGPGPSR